MIVTTIGVIQNDTERDYNNLLAIKKGHVLR